jgi:hypothetical protein
MAWLARESSNLLAAAKTALLEGQPAQAGALARAVQPHMVLNGLWGSWGRVADLAEQAAQASGDSALRAWALHERGTSAGLRGDLPAASADLAEARRLRVELGDQAGANATLHNMEYLGLLPPPPPAPPRRGWLASGWGKLLLLVLALLLLGGAGAAVAGGWLAMPTPVPPTPIVVADTPTLAPPPTEPAAPTELPTATTAPTEPPPATPTETPTATATPTPRVALVVAAGDELREILPGASEAYRKLAPEVDLRLELHPQIVALIRQQQIVADVLVGNADVMRIAFATGLVAEGQLQALGCDPVLFIAPTTSAAQPALATDYVKAMLEQFKKLCPKQPTDTGGPKIERVSDSGAIVYGCGPSIVSIAARISDPNATVILLYLIASDVPPRDPADDPARRVHLEGKDVRLEPDGRGGFTAKFDIGPEAQQVLGGKPGKLVYFISATDQVGNSSTSETFEIALAACVIL